MNNTNNTAGRLRGRALLAATVAVMLSESAGAHTPEQAKAEALIICSYWAYLVEGQEKKAVSENFREGTFEFATVQDARDYSQYTTLKLFACSEDIEKARYMVLFPRGERP